MIGVGKAGENGVEKWVVRVRRGVEREREVGEESAFMCVIGMP